MSVPELIVIAGALSKSLKPKGGCIQDVLAKRWRAEAAKSERPSESSDVIPLLDGWVRVLERQAGLDPEIRIR